MVEGFIALMVGFVIIHVIIKAASWAAGSRKSGFRTRHGRSGTHHGSHDGGVGFVHIPDYGDGSSTHHHHDSGHHHSSDDGGGGWFSGGDSGGGGGDCGGGGDGGGGCGGGD